MTSLAGWPDFQHYQAAQPAYDLLATYTNVSINPDASNNLTLPAIYEGIRVTATPSVAMLMQVQAANLTSIQYDKQQYQYVPPTPIPAVFDFPMLNEVGDTLMTFVSSTIPGTTATITVWGIRKLAMPCRSDGRAYPLGTLFYSVDTNVNNTTLINAPPTPSRIMLLSVAMACTGSPIGTFVTINQLGANLTRLDVNGAAFTQCWPGGLLLDPGTGVVTQNAGANNGSFSGVYDVTI